jgi:hypothetical protein
MPTRRAFWPWIIVGISFAGVIVPHGRGDDRQNLQDLRDAHVKGLPFYANWNVSNFSIEWQLARLQEGHRIIPSIRFPQYDYPDKRGASLKQTYDLYLGPHNSALDEIGAMNVPICLRVNNVAQGFGSPRYRTPKPWTKVPDNSPLIWRQLADGSLDDTPGADYLAPVANWTNEGRLIGESVYLRELQRRIPTPPYWIHTENHEGSYSPSPSREKLSEFKGRGKSVEKTPDGAPIAPPKQWLPLEKIGAVSLRMRSRVEQLGIESDPFLESIHYANLKRDQYRAYYDAMNAAQPEGWRDRMLTSAYSSGIEVGWQSPKYVTDEIGAAPDHRFVDGAGPSFYLGRYMPADLTDRNISKTLDLQRPAWEWIEQRNPKAFRTVFLWLNGKGALTGAKAEKHSVVSPDLWEAVCAWIAWTAREPGRALLLHHWLPSKTKPSQPFFSAAQQAELTELGRSDLAVATQDDYAVAAMRCLNPILDNATIREFWEKGKALPVTYPPGPAKVWLAVATLGGRTLLYAWTPIQAVGETKIAVPDLGDCTIDFGGNHSGYWVIEKGRPNAPAPVIRKLKFK